jgi:hypothetical protein
MDKEIKELKLQRDLAQSRLQDLLKVVGDNHGSKHPLVDTLHCFLVNQIYRSFITKEISLYTCRLLLEEILLLMFLSHVRMSNRRHQKLSAVAKILGFKDA